MKRMNKDFDWEEFHKNLDMAISIFIMEEDKLPSNINLMEFMKFSNEKKNGTTL